jgi:thiamine biosynthesis lipoprotein
MGVRPRGHRGGGVTRFVVLWGRWGLAFAAVGLLVAYAAVRRPDPVVAEARFLMDTLVELTLYGVDQARAPDAFDAAFRALEAVDREMARNPGTPLQRLNDDDGGQVSEPMAEVLSASLFWARRTRGAFDPTVAPLLDLWDIPSGPHPPPDPAAVEGARSRVGWEQLTWHSGSRRVSLRGTALDFGGIAKGYAIDRAAEALRTQGLQNFLLNVGGDLYVAGSKGRAPWKIGIQHPRDPGAFLRIVAPLVGALVTAGDYGRAYTWEGERFHHILDPRTGYPARGCQSVTIWAPSAIEADALATAVFVLGPEEGLALLEAEPGVEGLVVDAGGDIFATSGFARVTPNAIDVATRPSPRPRRGDSRNATQAILAPTFRGVAGEAPLSLLALQNAKRDQPGWRRGKGASSALASTAFRVLPEDTGL